MANCRSRILYGLILLRMTACYRSCSHKHTTSALVGHRCVTETEIYIPINGFERGHCILECMRRSPCTILNYNSMKNQCLLGNGTCVSLQPDAEYQVNVFSYRKRDGCLNWVSRADVSHPIATDACKWKPCLLGRLVSSLNMLPGRYRVDRRNRAQVISVLDGSNYREGDIEILNIESDCQVAWMSFTAGDAIPPHAVVGGYLASSGSALYIIMTQVIQDGSLSTMYGYYDPMASLGYIAIKNTVYTDIQMVMLVLLWSI